MGTTDDAIDTVAAETAAGHAVAVASLVESSGSIPMSDRAKMLLTRSHQGVSAASRAEAERRQAQYVRQTWSTQPKVVAGAAALMKRCLEVDPSARQKPKKEQATSNSWRKREPESSG